MGGQSSAAVRESLRAELPRRDPAAVLDFRGGGDQLRAGTMFLATLYFVLPLLGKLRPPLAFLSAESSWRVLEAAPQYPLPPQKKIAARARSVWDREVSFWGRGS